MSKLTDWARKYQCQLTGQGNVKEMSMLTDWARKCQCRQKELKINVLAANLERSIKIPNSGHLKKKIAVIILKSEQFCK